MNGDIEEQSAGYDLTNLPTLLEKASGNNTLLDNLNVWLSAQTTKSAGRGRSAENTHQYGVQRLRELILELALRGKLVPQDPNDEPAIGLINPIEKELDNLSKVNKSRKNKPLPEISPEDYPYELPQGWVFLRNGSLFRLKKGKKPKNLTENIIGDPYLDIEALDRGNIIRYTDDQSCPKASSEDILVVCDGSRSGLVLNGKNGVIGSTLAVIQTPKWLQHYIKLIFSHGFRRWNTSMKGAAIPHLDTKNLINEVTALPPLNEQHRIVKKVDELMALCDQLEQQQSDADQAHDTLVKVLLETLTQSDNAEDFQQNWHRIAEHFDTLFTTESSIDQLKQTLLQLAVMGKLVPQAPNDEPANVLLEKITEEKDRLVKEGKIKKQKPLPRVTDDERPFPLPDKWTFCRLQEIVTLLGDGLHGTPRYDSSGEYYFVNGNNLNDGVISMKSETKKVSAEEYEKHKKDLNDRTVLVSINGTLGKVAFYDNEPIMLGKSACYFNLSSGISKMFVKRLVESPYFWNYASSNATGSTIKNLGLKAMNSFPITLPPTAEQNRIVKKVDELIALCNQLKDRLNQTQTLKQQLADAVVETAITKD